MVAIDKRVSEGAFNQFGIFRRKTENVMGSDEEKEEIERLSALLEIPVWPDHIQLPAGEKEIKPKRIYTCEKEMGFVRTVSKEGNLIFISPKTDLFSFFQLFAFHFGEHRLYFCSSHLINEKRKLRQITGNLRDETKVSEFLRNLLEESVANGASDVHVEDTRQETKIRFRIHGVLIKPGMISEIPGGLKNKIKLIAKMDIAVKKQSQDGHFEYVANNGTKYDVRVSSVPGIFGEKLVMRILNPGLINEDLDSLGFEPDFIQALRKIAFGLRGWVMIAGPTGSGKTTTLYALVKELSRLPINILTIEDPVEYPLEEITQVEVNEGMGIRFSNSLRSFMRQDPDVIMVGEIRDEETAKLACRAAMTGHLVLSTVHAGSCEETLNRLRSLNVATSDLALSLKILIAQNLHQVPCFCEKSPDCKKCMGTGVGGRVPKVEYRRIDKSIQSALFSGQNILKLTES